MRKIVVALVGAALLAACGPVASGEVSPTPVASLPAVTAPSARPSVPAFASEVTPKGELLGPFPVTKVVDGDTIWVGTDIGDVKVRFIGIDTAETAVPGKDPECFGPEATAEAHRILDGVNVYIELDPTQGKTDRYGRTLAFVWLEDGRILNLEMVRGGFAKEYTYAAPYAYQREFRAAQKTAQAAEAGLWGAGCS